jgi:hypothetical protein
MEVEDIELQRRRDGSINYLLALFSFVAMEEEETDSCATLLEGEGGGGGSPVLTQVIISRRWRK